MNRFACIYIGPNRIDLITAQRGANRKVKVLDHAFYPLDIDYEIFQNDRISTTSAQTLERVIEEYLRLANESMPDQIDVVFSKDISKAENFLFVYFRIKELAQGCNFRILSIEDELELFCSTSKLFMSEVEDIEEADMMMTAINSESIDFALTNNGIIDYTERIPYGYSKLTELVEIITRERTHYSKLLGEIIESKLRLAVDHIGKKKLKYVSLTTKDAEVLGEIFECEKKGSLFIFSEETINEAYHHIKELTPEQIKSFYPKLTDAQSLTIQSTVIVARQLMSTAMAENIILIQRSIAETIVQLQFKVTKRKEIKTWLEEGAYQSAIALATRYNVDQEHALVVENVSERIFETLRKRFNLSKKVKRYLRLSSRLLDVGQYGGEEGQSQAVEEIILREEIIGLSREDRRVIARICHNAKTNKYDLKEQTKEFNMDDSILIAQCTAILKLSAPLDQSRRQKMSKLQCSLKNDELTLKITTSHNTQLENYYFNRDKIWMERVFDLKPILKVKRVKV